VGDVYTKPLGRELLVGTFLDLGKSELCEIVLRTIVVRDRDTAGLRAGYSGNQQYQ
jgi:hypothetical protein